ncbi:hypothetical protein JTB14_010861 [Gonioctena quinquepunctata]|nr:hypothetical protein JTB14_010861 [Gonioctena quinquepunctata]
MKTESEMENLIQEQKSIIQELEKQIHKLQDKKADENRETNDISTQTHTLMHSKGTVTEMDLKEIVENNCTSNKNNNRTQTIRSTDSRLNSGATKVTRFLHINVERLSTKLPILEATLKELNYPDILCVCEHWMNKVQNEVTCIDGYENVSTFCRKAHIHGGVAIYANSKISGNCKEINVRKFCIELDFEIVAVSIDEHLCVACIYRSPDGSTDNFFLNLSTSLMEIIERSKYQVIMGDLNIDKLTQDKNSKELNYIFESFSLKSLINEPTRIDRRNGFDSRTAIDYVVTNEGVKEECEVFEPHISDHKAQILKIVLPYTSKIDEVKNEKVIRTFSEQNMLSFQHYFNKDNSLYLCSSDNINDYYRVFMEHFEWALDVSCPKQKTTSKNQNKNTSKEIQKEIDDLKFLYYISNNSEDPVLIDSYKNTKKNINKRINDLKKKMEATPIQKAQTISPPHLPHMSLAMVVETPQSI